MHGCIEHRKQSYWQYPGTNSADFKCLRTAKLHWYYNDCYILNIKYTLKTAENSKGLDSMASVFQNCKTTHAHNPFCTTNMLCNTKRYSSTLARMSSRIGSLMV